jgi:hypothetical protein
VNLRAREAKLRKAEERLKIKEKSIDELKNVKIMLETRCQHLEARNFELEQTLKLLKRRIDSNQYLQSQKENETEKGGYEKEPEIDDIHHKMKLHMNTKIMGLHTKLTNLVFNEIDRHLDRLNLTEESAPKNSPKSHNQEHENEVTPSTVGKRHAEYSLKDIQSLPPTLTGQPLILGNQRGTTSQPGSMPSERTSYRQHPARNTPPSYQHQQHLINNLGISNVTSHQSPGCNLPPVYTIIQQPVHHDRKHPQRTKADMIGSATRNHSFLAHPGPQPPRM